MDASPTRPSAAWSGPFDAAAFDAVRDRPEPPALRRLREAAFETYRSLPLPSATDEEWRRTDPARFDPAEDGPLPAPSVPRAVVRPGAVPDGFDLLVRTAGGTCEIADPAGLIASGRVGVIFLEQAAAENPESVERLLSPGPPELKPDKYQALHDAFAAGGFLLRVRDGGETPCRVLWHAVHEGGPVAMPRLLVDAAPGARLSMLEFHESGAAAPRFVLGSRRIRADEGASVEIRQVQAMSPGTRWMEHAYGVAARDARIETLCAHLGADAVRTRLGLEAAGSGAALRLDGLFFASAGQHIDQSTLQVHSSPDTASTLLYKGAAKGDGRSVYRGLIVARRGAVRIDAYQKNNNLLLNDGARADSLPGLRIDADDLKCTHGATCGSLDPEQVFYLRARGLSESEARRLLVEGFFAEIARRIPAGQVADAVHSAIAARLGA